jgi:regulator of protease activity HflC (stomatin/prohibitin superfamily)
MFNPKRFAQYFGRLLAAVLPILVVAAALSLVTELQYREDSWLDLTKSWQFWLPVARDLIPCALALLAAYLLATRFVRAVYGLEKSADARGLVNRCLFGLCAFRPWLRISDGVTEGGEEHVLRRAGGPGHLVVYNDSAVLLERGGRFTRVRTRDFTRLESFERVYHVVDLRPKQDLYKVSAISKEGIPIVCEADISYQVDSEGEVPTEEIPFPASEDKVFQAATCTWIREEDRPEETRMMDWRSRVLISETEWNLRTILAQYPLDRLIGLTDPSSQRPREEIRQRLEKRLRAGLPKLGARILKVELGDIQVADEVTRQWIEAWQARWKSWIALRQALGQAKQIEQMEEAKTLAQLMMIKAITGEFRPMTEDDQAISSRLIMARLFMVLGRACSEPWTRVFLPPEVMNTLKSLKELIE